ncbi:hypothetical protein BKH46_08635 [Helicobacter sp. 12S02634-8]|uniref:hypothetical protein n=1 Tax=Helicobacter sp. 12S02634-8 TaxID=1476199 RepID=UPI000BA7C545|nr:hypothetical protein BKH46_08635 [Helicobacter sp. 12S02634-8]
MEDAKNSGFITTLFYIGVSNALDISKERIEYRVKQGLHFVDTQTIKNNLVKLNQAFKLVAPWFDNITIYDNSKNYETTKRILDIRNKRIYSQNPLPEFVYTLIKDTFIQKLLLL